MNPSTHAPTVASSPRFIDLTHPLVDKADAFPGDPPLSVRPVGRIATHQYNTTQIEMGSHIGTHLDAMYHFFDDGKTLDRMPLDWFFGPARALRIPKDANGVIDVADLQPYETFLTPGARIIINTGWHHHFGKPDFFTDFPSLTIAAAQYVASRRIRLFGMDLPTPGKQWLELHHVMLAPDIEMVLVESLANLDALPETFTFAGFPLPFKGRDGSPIRAVAICE